MTVFNRSLASAALTMGLMISGNSLISAAPRHDHQAYPEAYSGLREVVDRTQGDLKAAADLEHGKDDQRDRYRDAQGHLSTFDRKLVKGDFDKGELSKAIDKIKDILDKNVLQASSRDMLMRDLTDLKIARDRRD